MDKPIDRVRVSKVSRAASDTERTYYADVIRCYAQRRHELGITQEQLDTIMGVSDGQVAKWESFLRLPGAFMLVCWGQALGLSLSAIHHPPTEDR